MNKLPTVEEVSIRNSSLHFLLICFSENTPIEPTIKRVVFGIFFKKNFYFNQMKSN